MEIDLQPIEARILGAFIEKELTTPDYYPLSTNALVNACNQKSNRDPVMTLTESEVIDQIESLRKKGLAMQSQDAGSRVPKYRHTLRERLYLEEQELAILAELLLRGPQTPGELRARADRMASFPDLKAVDETLQELMDKEPAMVVKLPRQPGRKESRFAQLWTGKIDADTLNETFPIPGEQGSSDDLREQVALLQAEVDDLKREFQEFRKQFE